MCGCFAVACGGSARQSFFWHAGRLTTYMVLGALAGAFGGAIPGPGWVAGAISTALIVWFALVLAGGPALAQRNGPGAGPGPGPATWVAGGATEFSADASALRLSTSSRRASGASRSSSPRR